MPRQRRELAILLVPIERMDLPRRMAQVTPRVGPALERTVDRLRYCCLDEARLPRARDSMLPLRATIPRSGGAKCQGAARVTREAMLLISDGGHQQGIR